jgi:hypothetical protein
MDDRLDTLYSRWRAADAAERDDEADAAFRVLTEAAMPPRVVPLRFTERTTAAVAAALAADARRRHRVRRTLVWGGVTGSVIAAYFGAGPLLSILSAALVATIGWIVEAIVLVATGHDLSVWSVLNSLARASAAFIVDPKVTVIMFMIQGLAIGALVALRRLLGSDQELIE